MLTFDRAGKSYGANAIAFDGVRFVVSRGAFCVLLGPTGAGKSSIASGQWPRPCDAGARFVGETPVEKRTLTSVRNKVATIHQNAALVERLTVMQNVMVGSASRVSIWRVLLQRYPRQVRAAARALMERVGLDPRYGNVRASRLPGGEQQRVGIARAFMSQPEVILADEPVASLDPETARAVLAILKSSL